MFLATVPGPAGGLGAAPPPPPPLLAILVVFIVGLAAAHRGLYIVVQPLVSQAQNFFDALPDYVNDAEQGRGTIGRLIERLNLEEWVRENSDSVSSAISQGGGSALDILKTITDTVVGLVTILVLTILLLAEAPSMIENGLARCRRPAGTASCGSRPTAAGRSAATWPATC